VAASNVAIRRARDSSTCRARCRVYRESAADLVTRHARHTASMTSDLPLMAIPMLSLDRDL